MTYTLTDVARTLIRHIDADKNEDLAGLWDNVSWFCALYEADMYRDQNTVKDWARILRYGIGPINIQSEEAMSNWIGETLGMDEEDNEEEEIREALDELLKFARDSGWHGPNPLNMGA